MVCRPGGIAVAVSLALALLAPASAQAQLGLPGFEIPGLPDLPEPPALPVPTTSPASVEPGDTVTCSAAGAASYAWHRDGAKIADGASYVVTTADPPPAVLVCVATFNVPGVGSVPVASLPVLVLPAEVPIVDGDPGVAPANTAPPSITGTATAGRTIGCLPGTWLPPAGLTLSYAWEVAGVPVPGATTHTYVIQPADVGKNVVCAVTGKNLLGAHTARSKPVVPTAATPAPGGTVAKPANTSPPVLSGTPEVGRALACTRGEWSGAPSAYHFRWARGNKLIQGAESASYTLEAADVNAQVRCLVVAGNRGGYGLAVSRAVTPRAQADTTKPVISAFRFQPKRIVLRRGKGNFTWQLSEDARTTIVVERRTKGFKKGRRCVKVTKKLRKKVGATKLRKRGCARWVRAGKLSKAGKRGANKVTFKGKLGGKRLKPASYRAVATAKDRARNTSKKTRPAKLKLVARRGR